MRATFFAQYERTRAVRRHRVYQYTGPAKNAKQGVLFVGGTYVDVEYKLITTARPKIQRFKVQKCMDSKQVVLFVGGAYVDGVEARVDEDDNRRTEPARGLEHAHNLAAVLNMVHSVEDHR